MDLQNRNTIGNIDMEHGRRTFWAASLLLFALGIESGGFQISLLQMMEEFDLSGTYSGIMVSVQYSAIIIMPFLIGRLADYGDKRRILFGFGVIFLLGCICLTSVRTYVILLCSIFIIGSGYSVCESVISAHLTDIYEERSGKFLSISQCFFSVGALVGPQVLKIGTKYLEWDWRYLFLISGFFVFIAVLWIRTVGTKRNVQKVDGKTLEKPGKEIYLLVFGMFTYGTLEVGIGYYINSFVSMELNAADKSAEILSFFWMFMILGRILGGALYRWRRKSMICSYFAAFLLLIGISVSSQIQIVASLFGMLGLIIAPLWPYYMSVAAEEYQENSATATGFLSAGCGIGAVTSPILLGKCADLNGLRMGFLILAIFAVLGMSICYLYFKMRVRIKCEE